MKKQQLYFKDEDSETCHSLEYHLEDARDEDLKEIELFEAIPDPSKEYFWCRADSNVCMTDDNPCGKSCEDYDPRNGKSGICKHKTHCHTWGDKVKFNVETGAQVIEDKDVKIKMSICPECGNAICVAVEHKMDVKSKNEFLKDVMKFDLLVKTISLEEYRSSKIEMFCKETCSRKDKG